MDPSYSRKSWISPREWTTAKAVMAAVKLAVFALIEAVGYAHAAEVAGVRIDANARVGGIELELNGAGLRQRFATKIYVIGLTLMRDVPAQALVDALYEGVRDNTTDAEFARVETSANALASVMLPLQTAKKGDVVALDYLPDSGAQVVVNGRPIGQPIANEELYRALLKIWIGDPPVDADLKRALLRGQAPRKLLATERNK
jgi:hypothetical protein